MTRRGAVILLALLLGISGSFGNGAFGDEESAQFFTERGNKALAKKEYENAKKQFRKALTEHPEYLPAVLGLAETAKAEKKNKEAIGYLEACLRITGKRKNLSEEEEAVRKRAEDLLKKLDRARYEYRKIVADYIGKLLKLAKKHKKKDPELTRRCVERILRLEAENAEALALQKEVGEGASAAGKKGKKSGEKAVFNGENLDNWAGDGDMWEVRDGVLYGNAGSLAYYMRSKERLKGDYTLEFEARIARDTDTVPNLVLRYAVRGPNKCYSLNLYKTGFEFYREGVEDDDRVKLAGVEYYSFAEDFDRKAWNKFRFEVKGNTTRILVNDRKLFDIEGDGTEGCFDGFVGLVMQCCAIEVRRIAVVK